MVLRLWMRERVLNFSIGPVWAQWLRTRGSVLLTSCASVGAALADASAKALSGNTGANEKAAGISAYSVQLGRCTCYFVSSPPRETTLID